MATTPELGSRIRLAFGCALIDVLGAAVAFGLAAGGVISGTAAFTVAAVLVASTAGLVLGNGE